MEHARLRKIRQALAADERPSILISPQYEVLWSNQAYREAFGEGIHRRPCYEVSHGYDARGARGLQLTAGERGTEVEEVWNSPRVRINHGNAVLVEPE